MFNNGCEDSSIFVNSSKFSGFFTSFPGFFTKQLFSNIFAESSEPTEKKVTKYSTFQTCRSYKDDSGRQKFLVAEHAERNREQNQKYQLPKHDIVKFKNN